MALTDPPLLTDFLQAQTLQEIQDGFTALSGFQAQIVDAHGRPLTQPSNCQRLSARDLALNQAMSKQGAKPLSVPITVNGARLGSLNFTGEMLMDICDAYRQKGAQLARQMGLPDDRVDEFCTQVINVTGGKQAQAVHFLYPWADAIAQVVRQELVLRRKVEQMTTLFHLSTLLAGQRDLTTVLDTVVSSVAQVMATKAASIRLFDPDTHEMLPKAVFNLSGAYLNKGPLLLEKSFIDREALQDKIVWVPDMASDPRVLYPEDARHEGIASILCAGMVYRGRPIGAMRVYTQTYREFSEDEKRLLLAVAQLSAAAIANAQMALQQAESARVQRQVELAADVQRRMMPRQVPSIPPFDIAGFIEPSFELGGDFYDYIRLDHNLGVVVGDVVGKGVAASLLMASVRASLRAHVEDVYDIDHIMAKVNRAMASDTRDNEFATVFYGTLDAANRRLTYCSAGHEPGLLLRNGLFTLLNVGGMALGIDATQTYEKGVFDLLPNDVLVIHTDGVTDAMNFDGQRFGRQRLRKAILDMADQDAAHILKHILWEVRRFMGLNYRPDDMTLVAVKVGK